MPIVVVLFNLKAGAVAADYEQWARKRDIPNVTALSSVREFKVLKSAGLMSGAASPYQYVEILDLHSLEGLRTDVSSETMRGVASEFREFADAPLFIVTEPVE